MTAQRITASLVIALVGYAALLMMGTIHHAMWLDELQVWCLARDSGSLSDLFINLRNEGHPPLWPLLVWPLARVFRDPMAIGMLHALLALASAWLLLFRSPFPWGWRILMVFGYYVLFEYSIPARNYAPGMLALFCAADAHAHGRYGRNALFLGLLALTHYWGIVVALAWTVAAWFDHGLEERRRWPWRAMVIGCAGSAFLLAWPQIDLPHVPSLAGAFTLERAETMGKILTQLFVPLPDPSLQMAWNSSWVVARAPGPSVWIGLFGLLSCALCLWKSRRWTIFFMLATIGILLFPWLAPFRSMRYYGPVILAFIAAQWGVHSGELRMTRIARIIVPSLLTLQVAGGIIITIIAFRTPFSRSRDAVGWLRDHELADLPVVVDSYQAGPSVSGYLGRPVYFPLLGTTGSYCHWGWRSSLDRRDLVEALRKTPFRRYVLVAGEAGLEGDVPTTSLRIRPLASFTGSMISSEDHHLYLVETTLDQHEVPSRRPALQSEER